MKQSLRHLGALVGVMHDEDTEKHKAPLNLGFPNREIVEFAGVRIRHLSLEEMAMFQSGYVSPQENIDKTAYYDHVKGQPMN